MTRIFLARLPHVYFVYGLAFFILGLSVAYELALTLSPRLKRAIFPLALFGLVHGIHEWFEMFILVAEENHGYATLVWMDWVRIGVLAFTFLCLGAFGLLMIQPQKRLFSLDSRVWFILLFIYASGVLLLGKWLDWSMTDWLKAIDAWTRYSLGIPGAILAAGGLLIQRRFFLAKGLSTYNNSLIWAAVSLALYGSVGQFFVAPSPLFPSNVLNAETFIELFGFPIQIFRASMAVLIAFFIIRAFRGFEIHRRRLLEASRKEAQKAVVKRDALRGELLRRTVSAQEDERKRIARELHDEIGQTLTGLSTGLRGVEKVLIKDPDLAQHQLHQLVDMNVQAIEELSNLVSDLRPSLLDDLGLSAALDWYVERINQRSETQVKLIIDTPLPRFSFQIETSLFRIAQEAFNNILRHAKASTAEIKLEYDKEKVWLKIRDDGVGFDPAILMNRNTSSGWGLVGIRERVELIGGECRIESSRGKGTVLEIVLPVQISKDGDNDSNKTDVD